MRDIKVVPVTPAKAGVQGSRSDLNDWIPAFAQSCPGKVGATLLPRNGLSKARFSLLSPLKPLMGGEGLFLQTHPAEFCAFG